MSLFDFIKLQLGIELRNEEKRDACLTRLIMIGEYSAKISDELRRFLMN